MGLAIALAQLRCSEDPQANLDQALACIDAYGDLEKRFRD